MVKGAFFSGKSGSRAWAQPHASVSWDGPDPSPILPPRRDLPLSHWEPFTRPHSLSYVFTLPSLLVLLPLLINKLTYPTVWKASEWQRQCLCLWNHFIPGNLTKAYFRSPYLEEQSQAWFSLMESHQKRGATTGPRQLKAGKPSPHTFSSLCSWRLRSPRWRCCWVEAAWALSHHLQDSHAGQLTELPSDHDGSKVSLPWVKPLRFGGSSLALLSTGYPLLGDKTSPSPGLFTTEFFRNTQTPEA